MSAAITFFAAAIVTVIAMQLARRQERRRLMRVLEDVVVLERLRPGQRAVVRVGKRGRGNTATVDGQEREVGWCRRPNCDGRRVERRADEPARCTICTFTAAEGDAEVARLRERLKAGGMQ